MVVAIMKGYIIFVIISHSENNPFLTDWIT